MLPEVLLQPFREEYGLLSWAGFVLPEASSSNSAFRSEVFRLGRNSTLDATDDWLT